MKIAVTVTTCTQIGMETWQDYHSTKVFDENSTIKEIDEWIKKIAKTANFGSAKISLLDES